MGEREEMEQVLVDATNPVNPRQDTVQWDEALEAMRRWGEIQRERALVEGAFGPMRDACVMREPTDAD